MAKKTGKARIHPLLILLSILLFSLTLGVLGSRYFFHRDEQLYLEEYRKTGIGAPAEFGDSGLAYLLIGVGIGMLVGLSVGISA